jgi:hypothetical protein
MNHIMLAQSGETEPFLAFRAASPRPLAILVLARNLRLDPNHNPLNPHRRPTRIRKPVARNPHRRIKLITPHRIAVAIKQPPPRSDKIQIPPKPVDRHLNAPSRAICEWRNRISHNLQNVGSRENRGQRNKKGAGVTPAPLPLKGRPLLCTDGLKRPQKISP